MYFVGVKTLILPVIASLFLLSVTSSFADTPAGQTSKQKEKVSERLDFYFDTGDHYVGYTGNKLIDFWRHGNKPKIKVTNYLYFDWHVGTEIPVKKFASQVDEWDMPDR